MVSDELRSSLLCLARLGIGHTADTLPKQVDWKELQSLAERQGLSAIVLDGLDILVRDGRLPREKDMDPKQKKQWIGQVLQNYEFRYEPYRRAIAELAGFYNSHGFKMMVLKGYACSLDWPKSDHRPSGDIDIWQFGQWREADAALAAEKGLKIDSSHHHHTVFSWRGFMVENHYDFINVHHHRSHRAFEKLLKEMAADDFFYSEIDGQRVYLPSPNLHALFLMKHMMLHFSTGEITLKQLLDWAFFVDKHGSAVDWPRIEKMLEQFGMKELYGIFNAICVEELGFDANHFNYLHFDPNLKDRVLNEILSPEFSGETPSSLFPRLAFKYRRWRANTWKHRLCYPDSMWSAFWSGVWGHLLKPRSI